MTETNQAALRARQVRDTTLAIVLERDQGRYYAGDYVIGNLICSFPTPTEIRGIQVELRGIEYTWWRSALSASRRQNDHRVFNRRGRHMFYLTVGFSSKGGTHRPGTFSYRFSLHLEPNLPGSFICPGGCILYNITATILMPYDRDIRVVRECKVVTLVHWSVFPAKKYPLVLSRSLNYVQGMENCGKIFMEVILQKTAFLVGDTIRVQIRVENRSRLRIMRVDAKLDMATKYKRNCSRSGPVNLDTGILNYVPGVPVRAGMYVDLLLYVWVPMMKIYSFHMCRLLRRAYALYIIAIPENGSGPSLEIKAPITLWNSPVRRLEVEMEQSPPPSPPPSPHGLRRFPRIPHAPGGAPRAPVPLDRPNAQFFPAGPNRFVPHILNQGPVSSAEGNVSTPSPPPNALEMVQSDQECSPSSSTPTSDSLSGTPCEHSSTSPSPNSSAPASPMEQLEEPPNVPAPE